jgi:hypothetical protein
MYVTFIILVGALAGRAARKRWQVAAFATSVVVVGPAAGIGIATHGIAWGFPLADLVWWFDVVMLVEGFTSSVLASVLATPGCEFGVWRDLRARGRGDSFQAEDGLACVVGLHLLDSWEARRRLAAA